MAKSDKLIMKLCRACTHQGHSLPAFADGTAFPLKLASKPRQRANHNTPKSRALAFLARHFAEQLIAVSAAVAAVCVVSRDAVQVPRTSNAEPVEGLAAETTADQDA